MRGTWVLGEASGQSAYRVSNRWTTQLLEKESNLRLGSKKLVTCPVTSISDPGGEDAKTTGLMQSHRLEVAPCWNRAKALAALGPPAMLIG